MNSFKAVIVIRMMMNAAIDRKINHTDGITPNLIMRAIMKAINLLGDFKQKNNSLGDLFEAAGDAYKIHLYSRSNDIYPLEPLKRLYATA